MTTKNSDAGFYDEMWRSYAHLDAVSPAAFHRRRVVVQLAAKAARGARAILDVGCGQGELLSELSRALPSATVSGADLSEQSIADSRRRNPDYDLFVMDLTDGDFEQKHAARLGSYDLVVCSEVVEHIEDDGMAVRRLRSLLSPGGHLILTVPGGRMSRFDKVIGHYRHYRPRDLERLMRTNRLETERVLAWGFPFHNVYRTAVRVASIATIPSSGKPKPDKGQSGVVSGVLGQAYTLFGKALKPLFYFNLSHWGEQMIVVARRPIHERRAHERARE